MAVCSAARLGCGILHSEDLNPGQRHEGALVPNPFQGR
jgi:predicted nucleic acid-binding protein